MTSNKTIQTWFFFGLLIATVFLCFLVFRPFLPTLLVTLVFSVVLEPSMERLVKTFRGRRTLAAAVLTAIVVIVAGTVVTFAAANIFQQSSDAYARLQDGSGGFLETVTLAIEHPIHKVFPEFNLDLRAAAGSALAVIGSQAAPLLSRTAHIFLALFLGIVSLFFFLKDGLRFKKAIVAWSPLEDRHDSEILNRLEVTINSVIRGSLLLAVIQGLLAGIGFSLFGVPDAFLWGMVTAVAALIPGIGTALVVFPAIAFLFVSGHTAAAVGLFAWGVMLVGAIDNVLAPYLYGKGSKVHPLFMLFSVLGGITAFGPAGFLFGPIIVSLLATLADIYKVVVRGGERS